MMRQMRENTKWIMMLTVLAFVALMVFEWGMDITGRSGGLGEIGTVNGTPVTYEDYQAVLRNLYEQLQQSQEEPITSQQNKDLEDSAWDQVVTQILIQQELSRRGIRVTDDEIRQVAQFNVPPALQESPLFMTNGSFDFQLYRSYMSSAQADESLLLYVETYFRDVLPRGKLLRQVTTGLFTTDQELWRQWVDDHETVDVRYIPLSPDARIPDSEIQVSDAEIQAYYRDHQDEFEIPARATVRAVVLGKAPAAQDTVATLERARDIAQQIRDGADFEGLAAEESADAPTATNGGDLGIFPKGRMIPAFDSAAFSAPLGEVTDPVWSGIGYHLLRVDERWGQDSVHARHILIPVERSDASELTLLVRADSLEDLSESSSLRQAAEVLGLTVQDAELTSDFAFVAGAGQVGEGADWALEEASAGDVSPVFETSQAFYVVELVSSAPGGILPLEEARTAIQGILRTEKKTQRALEEGAGLVGRIRGGADLVEVAEAAGLEVREAGPFGRNDFVPGLGRQNAAIGVSFGMALEEVSDPVAVPGNVFIVQKLAHALADSVEWEAQKDAQRDQLATALQQRRLDLWLDGLRANARIVDRRAEVLQPVDEDAPLPRGGGFGF